MASDPSTHFLNPDVPLNHFPPVAGRQNEAMQNTFSVLLGIILWDILVYFNTDFKIVRGSRFNVNIFCFMASRIFALIHIVMLNIDTADHPGAWYITLGTFFMLSMATSSFLFLQRVLAIYYANKWVKRFFCVFWVIATGSDIVVPLAGTPQNVAGTNLLKDFGIHPWVAFALWLGFAFDTSVAVAISYKIWLEYRVPNHSLSWYQLASGRTLPQLPRLIFRGGLQYYLIVVWGVMAAGVVVIVPTAAQSYKEIFPALMLLLMATMTSRVFRNVRLLDFDHFLTECHSRAR